MALTSYQLMYTKIGQKKKRSFRFKNKAGLNGRPQGSCLLIGSYFAPPGKPNSAKRGVVQGMFKQGGHVNAFVPVIAPKQTPPLVLYSRFLIRGGGPSDLPCVHYGLVCGILDHKLDFGGLGRRSKYGLKRLTLKKTLEEFYSLTNKGWSKRQGELRRAENRLFTANRYIEFAKTVDRKTLRATQMSLFRPKFFSLGYHMLVLGLDFLGKKLAQLEAQGSIYYSGPLRYLRLILAFLGKMNTADNLNFNGEQLFNNLVNAKYFLLAVDSLFPVYGNLIKFNSNYYKLPCLNNALLNKVLIFSQQQQSASDGCFFEYSFLLGLYSTPFRYFNYDIANYINLVLVQSFSNGHVF